MTVKDAIVALLSYPMDADFESAAARLTKSQSLRKGWGNEALAKAMSGRPVSWLVSASGLSHPTVTRLLKAPSPVYRQTWSKLLVAFPDVKDPQELGVWIVRRPAERGED